MPQTDMRLCYFDTGCITADDTDIYMAHEDKHDGRWFICVGRDYTASPNLVQGIEFNTGQKCMDYITTSAKAGLFGWQWLDNAAYWNRGVARALVKFNHFTPEVAAELVKKYERLVVSCGERGWSAGPTANRLKALWDRAQAKKIVGEVAR